MSDHIIMVICIMKIFLYSSSVYSCYLFSISSVSVRSIPFLSLIVPIFAWNVPLVPLIFLKRALVFPIYCFPLLYLHWSLRKAFLSLLAILWISAFRWVYLSFSSLSFASFPFFWIFVSSPKTTILHFCISHFGEWTWSLPPVQCQEPSSIVPQTLYQIWSLESIVHSHCIVIRNLI